MRENGKGMKESEGEGEGIRVGGRLPSAEGG